jgi:hypothetical protein
MLYPGGMIDPVQKWTQAPPGAINTTEQLGSVFGFITPKQEVIIYKNRSQNAAAKSQYKLGRDCLNA